MRKRSRGLMAGAGLASLALLAAACGGSGGGSNNTSGAGSSAPGLQALNPGSGSPKSGGTLNMIGQGDVDYMDPNITYYSIGYLGARPWVRSLYSNPAIPGKTTTVAPDIATAAPVVSNGGKTYTVTLRTGVMWDTTPASQVTAAGTVLGLKRACNPAQPWGGLPDFETLIAGYQTFCTGFGKVKPTVPAIKQYVASHQISGVSASGQTLTINLVHPASYFADMLTLPPFNPVPQQILDYVPASAASQQHTFSDGPYKVQSYTPARKIVYVRNPAWKASTDPIRKAYVNQIVVTETSNEQSAQQQLQTNTAAAGMEFDAFPPVGAYQGLISQQKQGVNHNFDLGPTFSTNPYLVFNTVSPNNSKALGKVGVRQALSYGINRAHLLQVIGGPTVNPPLTHVLPPGINGSQDVPSGYNPYPYNPAKAKQMLSSAGVKNLALTVLYRPASTVSTNVAQAMQSDLSKIGVKAKLLGVPDADFYTKYLTQPSPAKRGVWDVAVAGWAPDWYGDAALSFFGPLFSGPSSYPPIGSNFGFYSNPTVSSLITKASTSASASSAASIWAQADQDVMKDAPFYPITDQLQPNYHASYVHNAVYIATIQQFDPTNVWLSSPGS